MSEENHLPNSSIPFELLQTIQDGTLKYTYRGIPCLKNPFDLSLYSKLLFDLQPRTIIEIGTYEGGSALWLSDQAQILNLDVEIISLDLYSEVSLKIPNVTFLRGDVHHLSDSDLPRILRYAKKPFLVIEDGPHTYDACSAALSFFHDYMQKGDYLIIEDGIVFDLAIHELDNGPNRAIQHYISTNKNICEIDRYWCDYYGENVTWNTNGYIKYI